MRILDALLRMPRGGFFRGQMTRISQGVRCAAVVGSSGMKTSRDFFLPDAGGWSASHPAYRRLDDRIEGEGGGAAATGKCGRALFQSHLTAIPNTRRASATATHRQGIGEAAHDYRGPAYANEQYANLAARRHWTIASLRTARLAPISQSLL